MVTTKVEKQKDPKTKKSEAKVKKNKLNFKMHKVIWQQRLGIPTRKEKESENNDNDVNKVYLDVPISEIKEAKRRGCKFDMIRSQWFSPILIKDRKGESTINFDHSENIVRWKEKERIYLDFPYSKSKNDLVKSFGGKWSQLKRKWYIIKEESTIENIIAVLTICDVPSREIMKIISPTPELFDEASLLDRILLLVEKKQTTPLRTNTTLYQWERNMTFGCDYDLQNFLDYFFDIKPYLEDENWFTKNEGGKLFLKVSENKRDEAFQRGAKEDEKGNIFIDFSKMTEEKEDGDFGYLESNFYDPTKNGNRRACEYP